MRPRQIPNPSYHPGRCAQVLANGQEVGVFGQIHPLVAQNYGVDAEFYCAELDFDAADVRARAPIPSTCPCPSSLPSPGISPWCAAKRSPWERLEDCIRRGAKGLLKEVTLFDIYRGKGVAEGKKSVAFNLVLRADDRSLTAEEADAGCESNFGNSGKGAGRGTALRPPRGRRGAQRVQAFSLRPAKSFDGGET